MSSAERSWEKSFKKLFIFLLRSENIPIVHGDHPPDCYCKIYLGKEDASTIVIKRNSSPTWEEFFIFERTEDTPFGELRIELREDKVFGGSCMGEWRLGVSADSLAPDEPHQLQVDLLPRPGKKDPGGGRLHLRVLHSSDPEHRISEAPDDSHYFYDEYAGFFKTGDLIAISEPGIVSTSIKLWSGCTYSRLGLILALPNRWTERFELYVWEFTRNLDGLVDAFTDTKHSNCCIFRLFDRLHQLHASKIAWIALRNPLDRFAGQRLVEHAWALHTGSQPSTPAEIDPESPLMRFLHRLGVNARKYPPPELHGSHHLAAALRAANLLGNEQLQSPITARHIISLPAYAPPVILRTRGGAGQQAQPVAEIPAAVIVAAAAAARPSASPVVISPPTRPTPQQQQQPPQQQPPVVPVSRIDPPRSNSPAHRVEPLYTPTPIALPSKPQGPPPQHVDYSQPPLKPSMAVDYSQPPLKPSMAAPPPKGPPPAYEPPSASSPMKKNHVEALPVATSVDSPKTPSLPKGPPPPYVDSPPSSPSSVHKHKSKSGHHHHHRHHQKRNPSPSPSSPFSAASASAAPVSSSSSSSSISPQPPLLEPIVGAPPTSSPPVYIEPPKSSASSSSSSSPSPASVLSSPDPPLPSHYKPSPTEPPEISSYPPARPSLPDDYRASSASTSSNYSSAYHAAPPSRPSQGDLPPAPPSYPNPHPLSSPYAYAYTPIPVNFGPPPAYIPPTPPPSYPPPSYPSAPYYAPSHPGAGTLGEAALDAYLKAGDAGATKPRAHGMP